jgi:hypothetical protein
LNTNYHEGHPESAALQSGSVLNVKV